MLKIPVYFSCFLELILEVKNIWSSIRAKGFLVSIVESIANLKNSHKITTVFLQ